MSIIQEALKRQEEEGAEADAPQEQTIEKPPEEPRRGRGKLTAILLGVLVLIAAAGGLFILYKTVIVGFLDKESKSEATPAANTHAANEAEPAAGEADAGAASSLGKIVSKVENVLQDAERNVESAEETQPRPETVDPEIAKEEPEASVPGDAGSAGDMEEEEEQAAQDVEQASPAEPDLRGHGRAEAEKKGGGVTGQDSSAPPRAPKEPVYWPEIRIKGIMAPGDGNRGTVLIGDRMLSDGDSYMGVRIMEISRNGVLLEYKNERRVLSTGQSVGN